MSLIAKIVSIMAVLVILLIGYAACDASETLDPEDAPQSEEVIGAPLALSGDHSSGGEASKASLKLKVLVVNSYGKGMGWEQDIQRGIVEGLRRSGYVKGEDYELKTFCMDTKVTYTTQEDMELRAEEVFDLIDEFDPAIVFVNNDNALKYVAVEYTKRHGEARLPFVFSGINLDPTIYDPIECLDRPGGPITGALERIPYYEAFSTGKRIVPSATKIVILADFSPSSDLVAGTFEERYLDVATDSPLEVIDYIQVESFEEWKEKVVEYQRKADFIGILNYYQLRDDKGEVVPAAEVANWTIYHNKLPEIGFIATDTEDGFLAAVGISYYETGFVVGLLGGEILKGRDPATIPIVDPKAVDVTFNLERAEMLGIKIPPAELAEATAIIQYIDEIH